MYRILRISTFWIAAWAVSASAQNALPTSGNVGIGITAPVDPLEVVGASGTSQSNIAAFVNGTNNAYTTMTGVGSASVVGTWSNGSQVLEFAPFGSGNGIISSSTGALLFQTNTRTTQVAINPAGNVGIGTTSPSAKLEVNGSLRFTGDPSGTMQTTAWTGVLCGGDYAEAVKTEDDLKAYSPGDVLVIASGEAGDVEKSSSPYSTTVAGIYATKPGVIGRRQSLGDKTDALPMAMIGIVPARVSVENGPIRKGDLLVTASTPGYAMKGTDRSRMLGAVIGKAMGSLESGTGSIEVLVTLQ